MKQETVTGILLPKGSDKVKFFLQFGTDDPEEQLKVLEQEIHIPLDSIDSQRNIPLKLEASIFAGQGSAVVRITQDEKDSSLIQPVDLDWEKMELATNKDGKKITLKYLNDNCERSFPVDIPPVQSDDYKFQNVLPEINNYLYYGNLPDIRKSGWPCSESKGIEQFKRTNVFGNDKGGKDLPSNPKYKDISIRFFEKLAKQYERTKDVDVLTQISWTYHGLYYNTESAVFTDI